MAYKRLTLEEYLWLIHKIRIFCSSQDLKMDATAKKILTMINKELKND